jgi:AbrB family looped-hinge helix DNA binding protein
MALVRLKPKGQMTIPAELRDRLRLQQGDLLEVSTDGRAIILVPKTVIDREEAAGRPRGAPPTPGGRPAWPRS